MGSNATNGSSMNMTMDMGMAMMTPYLHFGTSDTLIFQTWQPATHAALTGACLGLIFFCILERCLGAIRRVQEYRWRTRLMHAAASKSDGRVSPTIHRNLAPPFAFSRDVPRGIIHALQSTLSYTLMLVIMTFNGAFIISVIVGLGIGEVLVGRIGRVQEEV
ncbi:Ctr copper transporter [Boletus reticuloceps]|uniref:Copper transport protein n=1 Tax=Boletus reticuloceps TaxID=495285 RepID=A0A8I2YU46_9AGAM|nr:Ctr copper transporter [Boletus reticuloceps]